MYGKNKYLYTSVLAYSTNKFLSLDNTIAVMHVIMGAGGRISHDQ